MNDDEHLPGEDGPLPMRFRGAPVSDEEALGVARRHARVMSRPGRLVPVPDALPADHAAAQMAAWKLPPVVLMRAKARAEMEGVTLTAVVAAALAAYGLGSPGTATTFGT